MSYQQLNIIDAIREGEILRQQGMQTAIDHADAVTPQWSQQAFNVACEYVRENLRVGQTFKAEDIRIWAYLEDKIVKPPNERAWGGIAAKLAHHGLIEKAGSASVVNPKAHGAIATLWRKL